MKNLRVWFYRFQGGVRSLYSISERVASRKLAIVAVVCILALFLPLTVRAGFGESVVQIIGYAVEFFVELFGKLLIAVIEILVWVAQYNGFADSQAVNIGWVVARDLANMLFIVALIIIAFGSIVGWEQYKYNRLLGKLVLTAVLVNFSKAIALLLIDFSQVVMLTFVNAFRDVAAGNLTTAFGIRALLTYSESSTSVDINLSATVMIYALAIILIIIALLVTLTLVVVLVRRIISLWILIILSPLAFIASVMPGGVGSFNSNWWSRLGKEMFTGPVLAFFLWLTFSIIFLTSGQGVQETATIIDVGAQGAVIEADQTEVQAVASEIGSSKNLLNFVVAIVLLIHSLTIAKEAGGFAGQFAGAVSGKINATASRALKGTANLAKKGALAGAKAPYQIARGAGRMAAGTKTGQALLEGMQNALPAQLGGNWAARRLANAEQRRTERVAKAGEGMNMNNMTNEQLQVSLRKGGIGKKHNARRLAMTEELMKRNKIDMLKPEDLKRYKDMTGIRYSTTTDAQGNVKVQRSFKSRRAQERWEALSKQNPHMDFAGETDPRILDAMKDKAAERFRKLAPKKWGEIDEASFLEDNPAAQATLESAKRAYQDPTVSNDRRRKIDEEIGGTLAARLREGMVEGAAGPAAPAPGGPRALAGADQARQRRFEREQTKREQLGIKGDSSQVDDMLSYAKAKKSGIAFRETEFGAAADIVNQRTAKGESLDDVVKSLEGYKTDKDKMSDEEFEESRKTFEQFLRAEKERGGDIPELVGAESAARRAETDSKRAGEAGRASYTRMAANFETLDDQQLSDRARNELRNGGMTDEEIDQSFGAIKEDVASGGAGRVYRGQEKEVMQQALTDLYQKELEKGGGKTAEEIESSTKEFQEAIKKAQYMAIANTARHGFTLPHTFRHENAHSEIDNVQDQDPEMLESLFSTLAEDQQKEIVDDISKDWGFDHLPDDMKRKKAIEEYFTQGLANYGRTEDAIGYSLDDSMALALKGAGAKLRGYQESQQKSTGKSRLDLKDFVSRTQQQSETASNILDQRYNDFIAKYNLALKDFVGDQELRVENLENELVQKELKEQHKVEQSDIDELIALQKQKQKREQQHKVAKAQAKGTDQGET